MGSTPLKPCPFCPDGGKAHATQENLPVRHPERAECLSCFAEIEGPGSIDRWNTRAHLPSKGGEAVAWREHSVNYAKGEKCPETIETLQAAWDRDQELINGMRHEIARHKTRINRLEQRRPADQVADDLTMVKVSRELLVKLLDEGRRAETWAAQDELRALLASAEGVKDENI